MLMGNTAWTLTTIQGMAMDKPSMFPDHVILTKILGSRSREKKGVWGAFLGVFVDRIVRFGAIAESDGVILEKWTKF